MKTLAIIAVVWGSIIITDAKAAESYAFVELGVGKNTNLTGCSACWEDQGQMGSVIAAGYRWERETYYVSVHWTHLSHPFVGQPFNELEESSVDHIGAKIGWKFFQ